MENIYSILIDDIKWYRLPLKGKIFIQGQQTIVNELLKNEKSTYNGEYTIQHNDSEWTVNIYGFGKGLKATIRALNGNLGGFYDNNNNIYLNIKFCEYEDNPLIRNSGFYNDEKNGGGKGIYEHLTHELHHAFQIYLIKHKDEILKQLGDNDKQSFKTYIELLNACMLGDKTNLHYMHFNNIGNLAIKPYTPIDENNTELNDIAQIFYYLNISEYEAFKVGITNLNILTNDRFSDNIPQGMETAFNEFIQRYKENCNNIEENFNKIEDVVNLISNCTLKVYNHEEPKTRLEASIMYDICCIAHLEELKKFKTKEEAIEHKQKREQWCINLLQDDIKEKALKEYCNTHLIKYNIKDNIRVYKENEFYTALSENLSLQNLNKDQRDYNPKLVLYLASFYSYKHTDCFPYATDELRKYCQTEKQSLYNNPVYRDGATIIFGKDFWKELGMEEEYIEQENAEDIEYDDYVEKQDNQYNSTDISSDNTFNIRC